MAFFTQLSLNNLKVAVIRANLLGRRPTWALWGAVALVGGTLVAWPWAAGITPVLDDFNFTTPILIYESPWEALSFYWMELFFRPIDIVTGYLVDMDTLDSSVALIMHVPALLAIILAMRGLLSRLTPDLSVVFPLSVLWLLIHNSTAVTLWQTDTVSQVWSGACGLWLGLLIWDLHEVATRGRPIRRHVVAIVAVVIVGTLSKEIFISWCAVLGGLSILSGGYHLVRGEAKTGTILLCLALVVFVVPVGYLILRMQFGGLYTGHGKYTGSFDVNLMTNLLLGFGGYFSSGPIHVVASPDSFWWSRTLTLLTIGLNGLFALAACLLGPPGEMTAGQRRSKRWAIVGIGVVTFGGISAGLPTANLSEVYLMGPNAGAAVLVSLGIVRLFETCLMTNKVKSNSERYCLPVFLATALTLLVGVYGLASHAEHFRLTWAYAHKLEAEVTRLEQLVRKSGECDVEITLAGQYAEPGQHHSSYILPPSAVVNLANLAVWANRHLNGKCIDFVRATRDEEHQRSGNLVITAQEGEFPARPRW